MTRPVLFDYWRSSASYRVRIALNLLGIEHDTTTVDLLKGAQREAENRVRNPQGLVPSLEIDGAVLTQSLSIVEYLHETRESSTLLPEAPLDRQRVRMLSHAIAMEIHPVCNLNIVAHVVKLTGGGDAEKIDWMQTFISRGLIAFEEMLADARTGTFCHGNMPTMADICLVPQLYNARRWGVDLTAMPRMVEIDAACAEIEAFAAAHPDRIGPPAA